jgi:hypothetical protein
MPMVRFRPLRMRKKMQRQTSISEYVAGAKNTLNSQTEQKKTKGDMQMFKNVIWVVLDNGAGEIGRFSVDVTSENNLTWDILRGIEDEGWQLDTGDKIRIEQGSTEVD